MPNPYFAFKQFTIHHSECAMKVGTDACLLGAWATHHAPRQILDIGVGTGLISLMLAQRFADARVDGVEIEKQCSNQAQENVNASPWKERVIVYNTSIQLFQTEKKYDLIVSNPPYFSKAFSAPEENRHTARHDDMLSAKELFMHSKRLIANDGVICLIIPTDRFEVFNRCAEEESLTLTKKTSVKPTPNKSPKRLLLQYSLNSKTPLKEAEFYIEKSRGLYSEEFTKLLQDFYLYL